MGKKLFNVVRDVKQKKADSDAEKLIVTSILKTFNTGNNSYIEEAYLSNKTTTRQFYNSFKMFLLDFRVSCCSIEFLQCILDFWEKHGLNSSELEPMYRKFVKPAWFELIKDIEYKPFWNWMFTKGLDNLLINGLVAYSDISYENLVNKFLKSVNIEVGCGERDYFIKFLNQIWESVVYSKVPNTIEEAIKVLTDKLPNESVLILNSAYWYLTENEDIFEEFSECKALISVIEKMADYEYATDEDFFSAGVPVPPCDFDIGTVNITRDVGLLIEKFSRSYLLKDLVWLLENRFNISNGEIEDCLFEEFCDICMNYDLEEIMETNAGQSISVLSVLFCFADGEKIFNMFYDSIVTKSCRQEFEKLESEYGISY